VHNVSIAPSAQLGQNVVVMDDVEIGERCRIGNNVVLYPKTRLGGDVTIYDNAVLGRLPQSAGNISRQLPEDYSPLEIGDGSVIGACTVLYTGTRIANNVLICDLSSVRESCDIAEYVVLGRGVMVQPLTRIGARSRIMDMCHLPGDMTIEEDVFFSALVGSASENSIGRSQDEGSMSRGGPHVKRGAYVGVGASMLPGTTIGEDSVVGAGSLVTKDVPAGMLVMGVPARVVRAVPPRAAQEENPG
jgi:acetyltransferase-like isoleucine patch superfamily enzyme